jgi:hypothetical protein
VRPASALSIAFVVVGTAGAVGLASFLPAQITQPIVEVELAPGTKVRFASRTECEVVLSRRDAFVAALSPFDRAARLKVGREVDEKEFLAFVTQQVRPWTTPDVEKVQRTIEGIRAQLAPFDLALPEEIPLITTSGAEEGNAAYCRGNAIIFPREHLRRPAKSLESLFLHELFHISSRNRPQEVRDRLYAIVGFERCHEIELPEPLARRRITNPDAPKIEHRIEVEHRGEKLSVVPVLYSKEDKYDPEKTDGHFLQYLVFRLLVVDRLASSGADSAERWVPRLDRGRPWVLPPEEVPDYERRIGSNTRYVIHPEEILADNFVLLASSATNVPTPRILEEMRKVLARKEGPKAPEKEPAKEPQQQSEKEDSR